MRWLLQKPCSKRHNRWFCAFLFNEWSRCPISFDFQLVKIVRCAHPAYLLLWTVKTQLPDYPKLGTVQVYNNQSLQLIHICLNSKEQEPRYKLHVWHLELEWSNHCILLLQDFSPGANSNLHSGGSNLLLSSLNKETKVIVKEWFYNFDVSRHWSFMEFLEGGVELWTHLFFRIVNIIGSAPLFFVDVSLSSEYFMCFALARLSCV